MWLEHVLDSLTVGPHITLFEVNPLYCMIGFFWIRRFGPAMDLTLSVILCQPVCYCPFGNSLVNLVYLDGCIFNIVSYFMWRNWNVTCDWPNWRPALSGISLSALYLAFLKVEPCKMDRLREQWRANIPNLNREAWEESLEDSCKLVISSKDKLIHTNDTVLDKGIWSHFNLF